MGKQQMKKTRKTSPQRSSRLTKADMQALTVLDRLIEEDRRIEQKYNLPFRSPRQVATSVQSCAHCGVTIRSGGKPTLSTSDHKFFPCLTGPLRKDRLS